MSETKRQSRLITALCSPLNHYFVVGGWYRFCGGNSKRLGDCQ